jgi:hypothetical protein
VWYLTKEIEHQIIFGCVYHQECDRRGIWQVCGTGKVHAWFLMGKPEGKGPFERPWRRWENNIKMSLR